MLPLPSLTWREIVEDIFDLSFIQMLALLQYHDRRPLLFPFIQDIVRRLVVVIGGLFGLEFGVDTDGFAVWVSGIVVGG